MNESMTEARIWIFIIMLLALLVGVVYAYTWYTNGGSGHNSMYETNSVMISAQTWSPIIEVIPSTPSVGDSVMVYVKLTYSGSKEINVNPFELRSKYSINLTIVDLARGSIYLSRSLSHEEVDLNERTITVKPGDRVSIDYIKVIFVEPGRYAIRAHVDGPELAASEAVVKFEVKPGVVNVSHENMSRVGDWVLTLRVEPENPTVHSNLTLEVSLKYVGNESFRVMASVPLIKMVKLVHVNGVDSWSIAIPSHVSYIDIKPGYNQSFRFTIGPEATIQHSFTPGVYKAEAHAIGYTYEGRTIDITVTLFIRIVGR